MSETSGSSPIPWLTPEENAEWQGAYAEELAQGPGDEGQLLRRAGERTGHLWGVCIAPDGTVVLNPDRLSLETYAAMKADQREPEAGSQPETAALRDGAGPQPILAPRPTPAASPGSGQGAQGMLAGLDFPCPPGGRPASSPSRRAGQSGQVPAARQSRPGRSR
jgi:hypothetical protein